MGGKFFLFKNRDKIEPEKEYIERKEGHLFIKSKYNGRIAAGINRGGVAFVRSEVISIDLIKKIYQKWSSDITTVIPKQTHPIELLVTIFDGIKSAMEAVSFLLGSKNRFKPSNVILIDKERIFSLEINEEESEVKEVVDSIIKTNHFSSLEFGPHEDGDYPSSFERERYANSMINGIDTLPKLKNFLASHENKERDFNICRHFISSTVSSCIVDPKEKRMWYCDTSPCRGKYKLYNLRK